MSTPTFQDVQVQQLHDGVRYTLPRRDLPILKRIAAVIVVMDLFALGIHLTKHGLPQITGVDLSTPILLAVRTLIFVGPILFAIGLVRGSSQILVTADRIYGIERGMVWPLRWHGQRSDLARLEVHLFRDQDGTVKEVDSPDDLAAIKANFGSRRGPIWLAPGYPVGLIRDLADDLAHRLGASSSEMIVPDSAKEPVRLTQREQVTAEVRSFAFDVTDQPAGSTIRQESVDGGFSLTVPPAGVWKGSKGMVVLAIFWLLLCAGMTVGTVRASLPWSTLGVIAAFWLVGIVMLLGSLHMGKRQAIIDVIGDTLLLTVSGLFGTKQHEWPKDQIAAIRIGPSGMKVNNRPLMQLQVHPRFGAYVGVLTGRDDQEIRWVATTLRHALNVDPGGPPNM